MKKTIILFILAANSIYMTAQENNTWRFGLQSGFQGTRSQYVGGMSDANARFHQSPFGGGAFGLVARYDLNRHWMFTTGIGSVASGFEFAIAEDYSFVNMSKRYTAIKAGGPDFEIPLMVSYKFNPNCKNWRWVISGGLANVFVPGQNISKSASQANDGPSATNYLSADISSHAGNNLQARWSIGREKMFKSGSILSVSLLCSLGFTEMSHATVNYTIDGQSYQHEFSNKGTFVGFRVAYFLRPVSSFKTRAAKAGSATAAAPAAR
ncbi:MAG: outer membrane beta-barrel protein [Bacteroidia bacterium]